LALDNAVRSRWQHSVTKVGGLLPEAANKSLLLAAAFPYTASATLNRPQSELRN